MIFNRIKGGRQVTANSMKALRKQDGAVAYVAKETTMPTPYKHILWIEDQEDVREVVNFFLERAGYCVTNAGTSVEALKLAQSEHFDCYLLGDWFPHGYESKLCERIHEFDPHSPILFISAAAYQTDRQRGMDAGANGYLTKPSGLDDLEQTISRLLGGATSITAY